MTPPVPTEALVEALTQTMWEQSYGTLANASWAEAHRIAEAIPDGQAAWNIETVRRKAAEITNLHVAPLLAAHQQVTAERDEWKSTLRYCERQWQDERGAMLDKIATATSELARLQADVETVLVEVTLMATLLLMAGEMTAPERRTARAVAEGIAAKIRTALARAATQENANG